MKVSWDQCLHDLLRHLNLATGAKSPWNSARCNRLLRPLSSKITLLRKTIQSEPPRRELCKAGIAPPSPFHQTLTATKKLEKEPEISPRSWKKIKRTYSSRTNGQLSRESVVHDGDRAFKEMKDAVIRLPFQLIAGQLIAHQNDLVVKNGEQNSSAQRITPRAARGIQKTAQPFYDSQVPSCGVMTGYSSRRLIEGICKALEALLRATTDEKPRDNIGCRSLFSVCLRQIPSYIAEEQCLLNEEDPENDIDVASDVYTELEALASAPDVGWEFLREVVRAHGLSLVREAIQEGLIEFSLSNHILSLCLGLKAYDEAECVIEGMIAWMKSRRSLAKPNTGLCPGIPHTVNKWPSSHQTQPSLLTDDSYRVATALSYHVSQSGRHGFMYRQMAIMLENRILPIQWTTSEVMIECWNDVIRSITRQDNHAQSAALLLQVAISMSYKEEFPVARGNFQAHDLRLRACQLANGCPILRSNKSGQKVGMAVQRQSIRSGEADTRREDKNNTSQSTISNVLTVLSAITILRSPESALQSSHSALQSNHSVLLSMTLLRDIALEIRRALELANIAFHTNRSWSVPAEPLRLPLLSAGLVSVISRKAGTDISPGEVIDLAALASLPLSQELVCSSGSFLCKVARCCDEANPGDGFRVVQIMVQDLLSIAMSETHEKSTRRFCSGMAQATAFAFSEDTGQARHLDWALDIEGTIARTMDDSPKVVLDKTPARAFTRDNSGYKWEEGICEWIAKTPASALQRATAVDINRDVTYGEARKLALVQALSLRSGVVQRNIEPLLPRSKRRREGRGAFCDIGTSGDVKRRCSNFDSSEKLLFVRVSPIRQKMPRPPRPAKADMANDLDELSTSASSTYQPVALREIRNPPSGVRRKRLDHKYENKVVENCGLELGPAKRRCLDTETFLEDTNDELGLP